MRQTEITLDELKQALREAAGDTDSANLEGDVLDIDFSDLGYDSLALLETAGKITRDYGVTLADDSVTSVKTLRELLKVVNEG